MIVADTCVAVWLAGEPTRLSKPAAAAILEARKTGKLAIAGVTLFEISWLMERERIRHTVPLARVLEELEKNFLVLPITRAIAQHAAQLPENYPSDPMDRIIGATALDSGGSLITPDRAIRKSKAVPVIW